jgi:NAD(P)-dependent dehydrogenase (short-subunit alcohol dehydrogenase family)
VQAALVTGGSSGIGLAIARMLKEEGFELSLVSRTREKVEQAAAELGASAIVADVSREEDCERLVTEHNALHGRLDVLVNSAGVGIGAPVGEIQAKSVDMQLDVNLRALVLFYRECAPLLREAGAEHRGALVVNLSSISGKSGQPWLSVYSATKAAVIGFTQAMNKELNGDGVKSVALAPGFVDTPMTEFVRESVPPEEMISTADVAAAVRFVLHTSPACVIPEIVFQRPGEVL